MLLLLVGCAPPIDDGDDAWLEETAVDEKADGVSGALVKRTALEIDLASDTATARLELEHNGNVALEAAGLTVTSVRDDRGDRSFRMLNGKLRVSQVRGPLVIEYGFTGHDHADGLLPGGSTVTWPYFCGNLYPCHSQPSDGTRFSLALDGIPTGKTAVFPRAIDADAPSYMLAWAVGAYTHHALGTTSAGTHIGVDWLPRGEGPARQGTAHLVGVFDWYETILGPYLFGHDVSAVSVVWGEGLFGGMEHHPHFHVARDAMGDELTHAHEAAHGWFGDGVRLRCWEDFVLSEGTVSYLAARALGQVSGPAAEAKVWRDYKVDLDDAIAGGGTPAWPTGCNRVDILADRLFTNLPYMEGAFFYKDVAAVVGADVLDDVIGRFYRARKGTAAGMQDMIDAIVHDTGFDPSDLVHDRLRKQF